MSQSRQSVRPFSNRRRSSGNFANGLMWITLFQFSQIAFCRCIFHHSVSCVISLIVDCLAPFSVLPAIADFHVSETLSTLPIPVLLAANIHTNRLTKASGFFLQV